MNLGTRSTLRRMLTPLFAALVVMFTAGVTFSAVQAQTVSDWDTAYADLLVKGQQLIDTGGVAAFNATYQAEFADDLDVLDGVGAAVGGDLATTVSAATQAMRDGMSALAGDAGASLTAAYEALAVVDAEIQEALAAPAAPAAPSTGNAGLSVESGAGALAMLGLAALMVVALAGGRVATGRVR